MRLAAAASRFDTTLCADASNPATTFYGQLDLFDDSRRDGATVVRRILSVAPDVVIPAGRVLTILGEQWLVGMEQSDVYAGAAVRAKYVLHRADGAATIQSVAQALSAGSTATYAGKLWVKDLKEIEVSSLLEGFFNLYLPRNVTVIAGNVIALSGNLHMVRASYLSAAGFLIAECAELASGVVAATYTSEAYSPVTDTATPTNTAANLLHVRYQDDYAYLTLADPKFVKGDEKGYVLKSVIATAAAGARVTIGAEVWDVISVADEGLCWGLHLRRAGT